MDLGDLRTRLNKMTDRILMRLHDRAGFPQNASVYKPGAARLVANTDKSLLQLALEGIENYHALLGRFDWPDQYPIVAPATVASLRDRAPVTPPPGAAPYVPIDVAKDLIPYYINTILPALCPPGDEPDTHGETAYIDADLLELLHERINVGRNVALSKLTREPNIRGLIPNTARLRETLRDPAREAQVLDDVEDRARTYTLDPTLARSIFQWTINQTLDLEVTYLQAMAAEGHE